MIDIKLDTSNNITIENHDLALVDGTDFIVQRLATALRLFRGEWFLDTRAGVPYFQSILVKNPSLTTVREALREVILSVEGVKEITQLDITSNASDRTLTVAFAVNTTEGDISLETTL